MRKGARLNGMANPSELLINLVTLNKPKALIGLDQKRYVAGISARFSESRDATPPGERQGLNHFLLLTWNMVNPTSRPR